MTKRIIIETQFGPVTEAARHRAALNMRDDADLFNETLNSLVNACGGDMAKGMAEMRRRYPESFSDYVEEAPDDPSAA